MGDSHRRTPAARAWPRDGWRPKSPASSRPCELWTRSRDLGEKQIWADTLDPSDPQQSLEWGTGAGDRMYRCSCLSSRSDPFRSARSR